MLGRWLQMPRLLCTVPPNSEPKQSLVILLQFNKWVWCKEEAVWWKLILRLRDDAHSARCLTFPLRPSADKTMLSSINIWCQNDPPRVWTHFLFPCSYAVWMWPQVRCCSAQQQMCWVKFEPLNGSSCFSAARKRGEKKNQFSNSDFY